MTMQKSHWSVWILVLLSGVIGWSQDGTGSTIVNGSSGGTGARAAEQSNRELAMRITQPFTLAAVGDFQALQPVGQIADPGLQNLLGLLRDADVSVANLEGVIGTPSAPVGYGVRGYELPESVVFADLKAMGIRMVNQANNHAATDRGVDAMLATSNLLDEAGIVHAGSGKDLQEARAPRFLSTPKGIVGLVGVMSISDDAPVPTAARSSAAGYSSGDVVGNPGIDGLHLRTYRTVTADQLQALRKIRDSVYARRNEVPYPDPKDPMKGVDPTERLELFGTWYKVGSQPGDLSYTMDPGDLQEILRSIRTGKQLSDLMIVEIHCHQNSFAFQEYSLDNTVPDFLVDLAHQAIDNGADVFIAHGVHTLRGVEIYKGRPIFYGLASFTQREPRLAYEALDPSSVRNPSDVVEGAEGLAASERYRSMRETLLVTCQYEEGRLVEVRLHPADTGQDISRPFARIGIPMTPSPEKARSTLEKMQRLSEPFGTTIAIEDNVGVIRIPAEK
jgi:poly-gamma-glutamate capsule biosynthesis protein CapA/YwtB (metallophosphatase superfamily)